MKNLEYRKLLGLLPIWEPTVDDLVRLCPHLTRKQAEEAFNQGDVDIACPNLRVRGQFQIITLKTDDAGTPLVLEWVYTGKVSDDDRYDYTKEAVKFAEENWGNELIYDNWETVTEIFVQDPTDIIISGTGAGGPKTAELLYVCFNRSWQEMSNNSLNMDNAIVQMTLDEHVWHELRGGRGGHSLWNCAYCGSGLSLNGCYGCGHSFKDDGARGGWGTPLSRKMVEYLQNHGHVFRQDPEIVWKKEASQIKR